MNNITIIEHPNLVRAVSARELHDFLEIETPFHIWIERMLEYGFENGLDYVLNKNVQNLKPLGGRPSKDYFLTSCGFFNIVKFFPVPKKENCHKDGSKSEKNTPQQTVDQQ